MIKSLKNIIAMRSSALMLFVCAGLLLSGGAILGVSTAWTLLRISYYFWTLDLGVELGSSVLFITGSLLCLPTCWLATLVPYHTKATSLMATLMALASCGMLMLSLGLSSITGLSRAVREPALLNNSMLRAMTHDSFDPSVRSSFAAMQLELKCCGVQSHADWYNHRRTLPPACCGRVWNGKRYEKCDEPVYTVGCLRPALFELRRYANSITALGSSVIIVLGVTLFTAAYILVITVVERGESRVYKPPQPVRIACVSSHPPFVSLTSPAALSNLSCQHPQM